MEIKGWWGRAEQVCAVLCVPRICWCEYFYVPIDSLSDCRLLELSGLCGAWVYAWRGGSVVEKQHKEQKPPNTEAPVVHSGSSPRVIPASHQSCLWVPPNLCMSARALRHGQLYTFVPSTTRCPRSAVVCCHGAAFSSEATARLLVLITRWKQRWRRVL